jgi:hypothetical protein
MSNLDLKDQQFETLFFPPHMMPQFQTCDHLLYRIRDIFKLPQSQNETFVHSDSSEHLISPLNTSPPISVLQVGARARVARADGAQSALLRCTTTKYSPLKQDWGSSCVDTDASSLPTHLFEILPTMEVVVLHLNVIIEETNYAFIRVPLQERFPQCQDQEGFVKSEHLITLPALPLCTSAAVCLMRCVQRVALRVRTFSITVLKFCFILSHTQELTLGFVDYSSSEAIKWDNGGLDVFSAFKRFTAASDPTTAESFLRQNVFVSRQALDNPDVVDRVVAGMLE